MQSPWIDNLDSTALKISLVSSARVAPRDLANSSDLRIKLRYRAPSLAALNRNHCVGDGRGTVEGQDTISKFLGQHGLDRSGQARSTSATRQ